MAHSQRLLHLRSHANIWKKRVLAERCGKSLSASAKAPYSLRKHLPANLHGLFQHPEQLWRSTLGDTVGHLEDCQTP